MTEIDTKVLTNAHIDKPQLSAELNRLKSRIARHAPDLAVIRVTNEVGPAPAWYHVKTGDVTISYDAVYEDDDWDLTKAVTATVNGTRVAKDFRDKARTLVGLVVHETAHAKWSKWLFEARLGDKATAQQCSVLTIFEEIRIERRAIDRSGGNALTRTALRAAFQIILDSLSTFESTWQVASTWALTVGRAYASVAEFDEVRAIDDVVRTLIGDDVVDELHELLSEAVELRVEDPYNTDIYHDNQRILEIADRWLEITKPAPDESGTGLGDGEAVGDEGTVQPGGEGKGKAQPGDGEPSGSGGAEADETDGDEGDSGGSGEADGDDAEDETEGGSGDDADDEASDDEADDGDDGQQQKTPGVGAGGTPEDEAPVDISAEESQRLWDAVKDAAYDVLSNADKARPLNMADVRKTSAEVFGKKTIGGTRSWHKHPPSAANRQAATAFSRYLERINYSAPAITTIPAAVPPGRLDTRAGLQATAERARGGMVTAKPWQAKRRRHVQNPPLTIGLATDTSGSMSWAQDIVAALAYVMANGTCRIGGRVGAVTFGNNAEAVVRPGEVPRDIRVRTANGGDEAFDSAIAALEGVLHLTDGRGTKVLVVFSDNHLVRDGEPARRDVWLDRLRKANVAVVWVNKRRVGGLPDWVQQVAIGGHHPDDLNTAIAPIAAAIERGLATARK